MLVTPDGFEVLTRVRRLAAAARAGRVRLPRWPTRLPIEAPRRSRRRAATDARRTGATSCARGREALRAAFFARPTPRACCATTRASSTASSAASGASCAMPRRHCAASPSAATAAAQLFPHSDVDVLILLPGRGSTPPARRHRALLRRAVGHRLELGHACARSPNARAEMAADVTVRTSLLEHRLLAGLARAAIAQFRRALRRAHGRPRVLRRQDARAAAAAPQVPGRDLQPRAQRQGEPGRPARPADGAVDRARGGLRPHAGASSRAAGLITMRRGARGRRGRSA